MTTILGASGRTIKNEIWYCETCGAVWNRNDGTHYRYEQRQPARVGGSGETAWATMGTTELVLCGPMKRGRFVPNEGDE